MSSPPHSPWFNHPENIRWRIQVMKFIIMQFSLLSVSLPFRSKYLPQLSVLKNPQTMFLLKVRDEVSHPYSTTDGKTGSSRMLANIPRIKSTFEFIMIDILTCQCRPSTWNLPHFSNDSLVVLAFWFCSEFEWRHMIRYFVFSIFISRKLTLLF
jgi:hypothetical protein